MPILNAAQIHAKLNLSPLGLLP